MKPAPRLWGIDLGGTKIEGVIMDPAQPNAALFRLRKDTGGAYGYEHVISQIVSVVRELEKISKQKCPGKIGIGTPGAIEPATGKIKNSNTACLNGRPLRDDLSIAIGSEVVMANDANCFALAEATMGNARGKGVVLGLILGTGVGGGIVVERHLLNGLHGIAGEWGHNPLPSESHPCYCGHTGCVETVISGPALERYYCEIGGDQIHLPEIATRAIRGEELACRTMERLRKKFGEALAAVINILDPDAIVIGGGVGNLPLLYDDQTRAAIQRHLFNFDLRTPILRPALGDSAGVFGAAMLTQTT